MGKKQAYTILFAIIFLSIFMPVFSATEEAPSEEQAVYKKVILYVMLDSRDLYQVGVMDDNGKNKRVLTKNGNNWAPSVSPSGAKVAFYSDRSGFANLWVMNPDGTGQEQITNDLDSVVRIDLYGRGQICWSKEGDTVYFLKKGDIWKVFLDGETPSAITNNHDITSFRLSPDGNMFLYSRERTKKHTGLWVMEVNGTKIKQVYESTIINPAYDWGDNDVLVFFHNRGISTMTKIGVDRKYIKECFYPDNEITWSKAANERKSNKIAYISDFQNGPNIWIMNHDGAEAKQLTEKGGFSPFWLPDGRNLLYAEGSDIFTINVETKERKRLTYFFRAYFPLMAEIKLTGIEAAKARAAGENNADKK